MYCSLIFIKQRLYSDILPFIFIGTIYIIIFSIYLCSTSIFSVFSGFTNPD
jgi:hypothetical protein